MSFNDYDTIEIEYEEVLQRTRNATLYGFLNPPAEKWIPASVIVSSDEGRKRVDVAQWFVEKEGLEDYAC